MNTCWCVGVPVSTVVRRDERAGRGGKQAQPRSASRRRRHCEGSKSRRSRSLGRPDAVLLSVFRTVNVVARVGRPPRSVTVVVVAGFGGVGRRVEMNRTNETTLSGGSLGSRVDEERSQLRELM